MFRSGDVDRHLDHAVACVFIHHQHVVVAAWTIGRSPISCTRDAGRYTHFRVVAVQFACSAQARHASVL